MAKRQEAYKAIQKLDKQLRPFLAEHGNPGDSMPLPYDGMGFAIMDDLFPESTPRHER